MLNQLSCAVPSFDCRCCSAKQHKKQTKFIKFSISLFLLFYLLIDSRCCYFLERCVLLLRWTRSRTSRRFCVVKRQLIICPPFSLCLSVVWTSAVVNSDSIFMLFFSTLCLFFCSHPLLWVNNGPQSRKKQLDDLLFSSGKTFELYQQKETRTESP